jgi:hypothetical protein
MQAEGMSLEDIAAELNRRDRRAINGVPWDRRLVTGIIRKDAQIRTSDFFTTAASGAK